MATKVLYRKRRFLNRLGHHSGAFLFAEILRESWSHKDKKTKERRKHSHRYITLSIADCSRIIDLDFDLDNSKNAQNGIRKLDILIDTLKEFRGEFKKELEIIKTEKEKHKKH